MTMTQHENNKDEGDYEDDCEPTKARFCTDLAKEKDDYDPTQVIHTHAYNNDCEAEDDCDPTRALYCRYRKDDFDYENDYDPTRALYSAGFFVLQTLHHPYITLGGSPA